MCYNLSCDKTLITKTQSVQILKFGINSKWKKSIILTKLNYNKIQIVTNSYCLPILQFGFNSRCDKTIIGTKLKL